MIPLVCLDVDGTLVGKSGSVSDAVWQAVDTALASGQHLALSTARGAFGASWDMARRLDPDGWHVFHNGGGVVHAGTSEVRGRTIADDAVARALEFAEREGWVIELYSATDYSVENDGPIAVDHAALMGVPFRVRPHADLDGDVVRVQYVVEIDATDAVLARTAELGLTGAAATSPITPGIAFVSMTVAGVTKATGIGLIADELSIDMADVMMVGDGLNDLPGLEAVGHPVAMGNAVPEVSAAARHHVADVEDDGVAEALALSATID